MEALGLESKSRKYEGMRDAKTKLPNGGGKHIIDIICGEGAHGITTFSTGTYKVGKQNGHYVMQISKDDRYEGEMVDGEMSGIGKRQVMSVGRYETYIGEWKAGFRNGFGKSVDTVNNFMYVGEFKDGLWHGHGRLKGKNEQFYGGDFQFGYPHGIGKKVTEVTTLEGQWVEGLISGSGKLVSNDGLTTYIGGFYKGTANGYGQATHKALLQHWCKGGTHNTFVEKNEGNFKNGKRHGYGKVQCCDGTVYVGRFFEGKYNGNGVLLKAGGRFQYEGTFADG